MVLGQLYTNFTIADKFWQLYTNLTILRAGFEVRGQGLLKQSNVKAVYSSSSFGES